MSLDISPAEALLVSPDNLEPVGLPDRTIWIMAAACGTAIISDRWEGLDAFFSPGEEIILAESATDVVAALEAGDQELSSMARRARERTLEEHSSSRRAAELIQLLERQFRAQPGVLVPEEA